ncbi:hypothetical protein BDW74DRAFT_121102 [Aspergillus multicolor]|uniref:uncharacterized protein n=1 Tax=Aspergillus multicolor TaxID=41759 RepID=UPI003CCCD3D9
MSSANANKPPRPETDYERWLREQNEDYEPGERPLYEPPVEGLEDTDQTGLRDDWEDSQPDVQEEWSMSHGYFVRPSSPPRYGFKGYAMIIMSVLLLVVFVTKSVRGLRQRRYQRGGIPRHGKAWDRSKKEDR